MNKKGILLCGHGTRIAEGVQAFNEFAKEFESKIDGFEVTSAFLELSEPDFDAGVKKLVDKGVEEIIALPLFLFTGVHIQKDIPCMLYQCQKKYNVPIKMANFMGACEEMVRISEQLIRDAIPSEMIENAEDTALIVAGVGSSKVEANGDIAMLTRLIQERFRFAFATNGFLSRMTFPPLKETLRNVALLPYKNIVIQPYFFFSGIYIHRAESAIKKAIKENPEKNIICTQLLATHSGLYELLQKRLNEVLSGDVDIIGAMDKETLENYSGHHHHGCGHHHHHHHHHHDEEHKDCNHTKN